MAQQNLPQSNELLGINRGNPTEPSARQHQVLLGSLLIASASGVAVHPGRGRSRGQKGKRQGERENMGVHHRNWVTYLEGDIRRGWLSFTIIPETGLFPFPSFARLSRRYSVKALLESIMVHTIAWMEPIRHRPEDVDPLNPAISTFTPSRTVSQGT